ncbi:S1 family peptidase [Aldersonia sp. NBC_00410]|uniref:hypothetical protein n=1 Tax=Aldersonia sp. NBC_00410 TaxID=2975954 RepID=UPI00224C9B46|nr:hypothetical protein [Aldersonia sp. NBC_00410]MCX5044820.1 S1 family peptidase [Aldersonia sp. NBC_00410]MCX5046307.1 S1 family peptidase [Aldersonia sp. NBC_00410]
MMRTSGTIRLTIACATAVTATIVGGICTPASASPPVVINPGSGIVHDSNGCTIGFTGVADDGTKLAFTAGHCLGADPTVPVTDNARRPIGRFADAVPERSDVVSSGDARGYGVIELYPSVQISSVDRDWGQVLQGFADAHVDDRICHIGRHTGLACGTVTAIAPNMVTARLPVGPGDSGGPAYISTGPHMYRLVGIVMASDERGRTTLIDPIDRFLTDVHAAYGTDWSTLATLPHDTE